MKNYTQFITENSKELSCEMTQVASSEYYDYYVGTENNFTFYNIVPTGAPAPSGGYFSKEFIFHIKHDAPDLFKYSDLSETNSLNEAAYTDHKEVVRILTENGWELNKDYFKEGKDYFGNGRPDAYGFYITAVKEKLGEQADLDQFLESIGLQSINVWVGSWVHGWIHRVVRVKVKE